MVKRKKKKKVTSSASKKLEVGKKILQESKQLLKIRKAQIVETKKKLTQMGAKNIGARVNVDIFEIAGDIKDFKELEDFMDVFIPSLTAADVALLAAQYTEDKMNMVKILKDPAYQANLFGLLDAIDETDGGAVKVFNNYNNEKINPLTEFIKDTGYKMPKNITTFQNQITAFREHFRLTRKWTKPLYEYRETKEEKEAERKKVEALNNPETWRWGKK